MILYDFIVGRKFSVVEFFKIKEHFSEKRVGKRYCLTDFGVKELFHTVIWSLAGALCLVLDGLAVLVIEEPIFVVALNVAHCSFFGISTAWIDNKS